MHFLKQAIYGLVLLCACATSGFATPIFIQSGTWVVDSELNGLPGRGMAIDVQNQHLVMQVYNYNRAGQPTFHLASGPLDGLRFKGSLIQYRGGRFFGSGERVAWQDEVAGEVRIQFVSSASGFIQFPGEPEVAISRFRFDGVQEGFLLKNNVTESWMAMEFDAEDRPAIAWSLGMYRDKRFDFKETLGASSSNLNEMSGNVLNPCFHSRPGGWMKCDVTLELAEPGKEHIFFEFRKDSHGMEGFITRPEFPNSPRKLRGVKHRSFDAATSLHHRLLSEIGGLGYVSAPEPGTWIVSKELNGTPGRGMAFDFQNGVLVMQVYNYEKNGDPSFHLAVGELKELVYDESFNLIQPHFSASLKRYAGGRHFGSQALVAQEVADAGEVQIIFHSPTQGLVKFPGEGWITMKRFQFGYRTEDPQALLGEWAFLVASPEEKTWVKLSRVEGVYAKGDNTSCHFFKPTQPDQMYYGTVRCTIDHSENDSQRIFAFDFSTEYRVAPATTYFRYLGQIGNWEGGFAIQTRDKNGTPIGFDRIDQ